MPTKQKTQYVVGQRPPMTLTPKARRQLANAKPSKKVAELAEIVAKHLSISSTGTKYIILAGVNSLPPVNSTSGMTALEAAAATRKPAMKSKPRKSLSKVK